MIEQQWIQILSKEDAMSQICRDFPPNAVKMADGSVAVLQYREGVAAPRSRMDDELCFPDRVTWSDWQDALMEED